MKKFFSFMCALAIVLSASAVPQLATKMVCNQKIEVKQSPRLEKAKLLTKSAVRAPKAKSAENLVSGTLYTVGGAFYAYGSSGWSDITSKMPSIELTVDGDNVSIAGLAYWFKENAVTGTLSGNTITIPCQLVGTDSYGDEFLVGSNDGSTVCDIVFTWDPEALTLTADTKYILESSAIDELSIYCYWSDAVFGAAAPEAPELVVLPDGATVEEYTMNFTDDEGSAGAKSINVAVVDDKVYFQGMSNYLPESWVVGTKEGNAVTFAADQYVGEYYSYTSYFFYKSAVVFNYDAEADTYSAEGEVFGVLGDAYYDGSYTNPVLSKAKAVDLDHPIEVAITELLSRKYDSSYGDVIYKLGNAASDTIFQFDIYVDESLEDVELGKTYTLADMETSASYSFVQAGESVIGFKEVSFVKTGDSDDDVRIEATVVDGANNVYHFVFTGEIVVPTPVVVPEDLVTAAYKFVGTDTYYNKEVSKFINVGFDGDEVYFPGLSDYVEDAWIKGIIATDGTVTLEPCFLGTYSTLFGESDMSFEGGSMTYDADLDQFTCAEFVTTDGTYNWDEYADILITRFTEVAATPADPSIDELKVAGTAYPNVQFTVPSVSTEGEDLNPEKLSYIFFIQKGEEVSVLELTTDLYTKLDANMTEIPYNFSDSWDIYNGRLYLTQGEEEIRTWSKLGLQSIYRGGDEEHKSNIVWFDVAAYWEAVDQEDEGEGQGLENVELTEQAQKVSVDGQLFIIRDNKIFNAIGTRVR